MKFRYTETLVYTDTKPPATYLRELLKSGCIYQIKLASPLGNNFVLLPSTEGDKESFIPHMGPIGLHVKDSYSSKELCDEMASSSKVSITVEPRIFATIPIAQRKSELAKPTYITMSTYVDYAGMITDLEQKGVVECMPSEYALTTDGRCFKFPGSDEPIEVDCLGTKLCQDITNKVEALWLKECNRTDND